MATQRRWSTAAALVAMSLTLSSAAVRAETVTRFFRVDGAVELWN